jgi:hypothetical protein
VLTRQGLFPHLVEVCIRQVRPVTFQGLLLVVIPFGTPRSSIDWWWREQFRLVNVYVINLGINLPTGQSEAKSDLAGLVFRICMNDHHLTNGVDDGLS